MSRMLDITPTLLVAAVAPRTCKIIKINILKEEITSYKMVYYTWHFKGLRI